MLGNMTEKVFNQDFTALTNEKQSEPLYSDIVKNIKQGKYMRAYKVAWSVRPFETSAANVVAVSPVWFWYGWYFVPWRNKRRPYTASQSEWRSSIGSSLKNPAILRTFLFLWGADQIHAYMKKSLRDEEV